MASTLSNPAPPVDPGGPCALPYEAMFMDAPLPAALSRLSDGMLVAVNQAWLALSGLARDEAIGRTTVELGQWPSEEARRAYLNEIGRASCRERV